MVKYLWRNEIFCDIYKVHQHVIRIFIKVFVYMVAFALLDENTAKLWKTHLETIATRSWNYMASAHCDGSLRQSDDIKVIWLSLQSTHKLKHYKLPHSKLFTHLCFSYCSYGKIRNKIKFLLWLLLVCTSLPSI